MVGQTAYGWYAYAELAHIHSATVAVNHRDVFAEVALSRVNFMDDGEDFYGSIGITQVISASGVENFDPARQGISRRNVTSITVQITVISAFARGRLMVNYWS